MGWKHTAPAWKVRGLRPHVHHVLLALAHQACEDCGITWLGVNGIHERTGIGLTSVRDALAELVRQDLVRVYAYPKGGRGKSTEYIVLPQVIELSTGLCGNCRARQGKAPPSGGYDNNETPKGTAERWVSGKPTGKSAKTHRTGNDHSSSTTHSSGSLPLAEAVASPPVSNQPITPAENAAMAREMVKRLSERRTP